MLPASLAAERERITALGAAEQQAQQEREAAAAAQQEQVARLAGSVRAHLSERYLQDEPSGLTPRKREVQVPEQAVIGQLRTPAYEWLLQEHYPRYDGKGAPSLGLAAGVALSRG